MTMKLLTKESDYAIRALLLLARQPGKHVSSSAIAKAEHLPLQFLRRILRVLTKAGYVETKEGVAGGVMLIQPPGEIALSEIISLFQGVIQFTECLFRKKLCHNRATCVLRHRIMKIEETVSREFRDITIETLLNDLETTDETQHHNN